MDSHESHRTGTAEKDKYWIVDICIGMCNAFRLEYRKDMSDTSLVIYTDIVICEKCYNKKHGSSKAPDRTKPY